MTYTMKVLPNLKCPRIECNTFIVTTCRNYDVHNVYVLAAVRMRNLRALREGAGEPVEMDYEF